MKLNSNLRTATQRDRVLDSVTYMPSMAEGLEAKVSEGFRYTTTNLALEEGAIAQEEREQYGVAAVHDEGMAGGIWDVDIDQHATKPAPLKKLMPKEEWEESQYYRKGIEWNDQFSDVRARVLAESFDKRRYVDEVLSRRGQVSGIGENILGFGASMIGGLPDPINLIPVTGAVSATTLAGRVGIAAADGLVSTALADAIVMPELKRRGDDITMADFIGDLIAGTVLGAGMGAVTHGAIKIKDHFSTLAERRRGSIENAIREAAEEQNAPHVARAAEKPPEGFEEALADRYKTSDAPEGAARAANDAIEEAVLDRGVESVSPEEFIEAKFATRVNLTGAEKADLYNALEKAISDTADLKDVNVSDLLKNSSVYNKLPEEVKASLDMAQFTPKKITPVDDAIAAAEAEIDNPNELDEVQRMQDEGVLTDIDVEEMREADSVVQRVDQYEEAGLEFLGCIAGI